MARWANFAIVLATATAVQRTEADSWVAELTTATAKHLVVTVHDTNPGDVRLSVACCAMFYMVASTAHSGSACHVRCPGVMPKCHTSQCRGDCTTRIQKLIY
jgi:hypothetical protein